MRCRRRTPKHIRTSLRRCNRLRHSPLRRHMLCRICSSWCNRTFRRNCRLRRPQSMFGYLNTPLGSRCSCKSNLIRNQKRFGRSSPFGRLTIVYTGNTLLRLSPCRICLCRLRRLPIRSIPIAANPRARTVLRRFQRPYRRGWELECGEAWNPPALIRHTASQRRTLQRLLARSGQVSSRTPP